MHTCVCMCVWHVYAHVCARVGVACVCMHVHTCECGVCVRMCAHVSVAVCARACVSVTGIKPNPARF